MKTVFKFWLIGYDDRIRDEYKNKLTIAVFATNEDEAVAKASKLVSRQIFEVTEVAELINDSKE
jgi:hypothetical protein